jgi:hypothetical protein
MPNDPIEPEMGGICHPAMGSLHHEPESRAVSYHN